MVKKDFKKVADKLEKDRSMTILYGGVLLDVTRFRNANYDPWAAHVNDPMTKLKAWLDKTGYRLVDLLLTFDRDKSLTLDLEELKAGIKVSSLSGWFPSVTWNKILCMYYRTSERNNHPVEAVSLYDKKSILTKDCKRSGIDAVYLKDIRVRLIAPQIYMSYVSNDVLQR